MIDTKKINDRIIELWKDQYKGREDKVLSPLLYPCFDQAGVLFIGLNPSFNQKFLGTFPDVNFYLSCIDDNRERLLEIENYALKKYSYFTKIRSIFEDDNFTSLKGLRWSHIDLFLVRETNENIVKKEFHITKNKKTALTDFAEKQVNLAFELIDILHPQQIVVVSACASDIIRRYKKITPENFDTAAGTYRVSAGGKEIPIFFSGMLSGQHAVDDGTFERLKWQMNRIPALHE